MVYSSYPRRVKCLTMQNDVITNLKQHILLSYCKILAVGPVWSLNPWQQIGTLPTELTRQRLDPVLYSGFQLLYSPIRKAVTVLSF